MALFKPFKGSRASLETQQLHDGYAYFCTDDGSFHIDYVDANGVTQRKQINAKYAEALTNYNIATILSSSNTEIPTSQAVMNAVNSILAAVMPKLTSVTMLSSNWNEDGDNWSQVVACNGVTANSKLDLQPTPEQIVELQDAEIALMATNNDSVVTIYAIGDKPISDMTMQILITEVSVV